MWLSYIIVIITIIIFLSSIKLIQTTRELHIFRGLRKFISFHFGSHITRFCAVPSGLILLTCSVCSTQCKNQQSVSNLYQHNFTELYMYYSQFTSYIKLKCLKHRTSVHGRNSKITALFKLLLFLNFLKLHNLR